MKNFWSKLPFYSGAVLLLGALAFLVAFGERHIRRTELKEFQKMESPADMGTLVLHAENIVSKEPKYRCAKGHVTISLWRFSEVVFNSDMGQNTIRHRYVCEKCMIDHVMNLPEGQFKIWPVEADAGTTD